MFHGTSIVKRRGVGKWPCVKGITQRKLQPQGQVPRLQVMPTFQSGQRVHLGDKKGRQYDSYAWVTDCFQRLERAPADPEGLAGSRWVEAGKELQNGESVLSIFGLCFLYV